MLSVPARIPNFLRSRRTSPMRAFRITFRALPTRKMLFLGITSLGNQYNDLYKCVLSHNLTYSYL